MNIDIVLIILPCVHWMGSHLTHKHYMKIQCFLLYTRISPLGLTSYRWSQHCDYWWCIFEETRFYYIHKRGLINLKPLYDHYLTIPLFFLFCIFWFIININFFWLTCEHPCFISLLYHYATSFKRQESLKGRNMVSQLLN